MTRLLRALPLVVLLLAAGAAPAQAARDLDGDGYAAGDCGPLDPAVHPGAPDAPDLDFEDANCDGVDGTAARAYFVSSSAPNDSGTGSREIPFRTIQFAVDRAAADSPRRAVYIMGGSYSESITLRGGVSLYGGYAPSGARSATGATTITAPGGAAQTLLADGATGVELQLLDVRGPDRAGAGAGASSYAIRAVSNASLALTGVTARGGTAASGANGTPGSAGTDADAGGCGGFAWIPNAHGLFTPTCGAVAGGGAAGSGAENGGPGGTAQTDADGLPGDRGRGPSPGIAGGRGVRNPSAFCLALGIADCRRGGPGGEGGAGATGATGAGAVFAVTAAGGAWLGAGAAGGGAPGGPGSGGGGGGAGGGYGSGGCQARGGAGGGGGGGGGGGTGGLPGGNGGGSFALYIFNASAVVAGGALTGGTAGAGGRGGDGGPGGAPGGAGFGALSRTECGGTTGAGGDGGPGGRGGRGGGGGGGAGGPSAAVLAAGSAKVALHSSTTAAGGQGGGAGPAGNTATPSGAAGPSAPMLAQASANAGAADFDGDAVADPADACPAVAAAGAGGCPARADKLADRDGDGIPDTLDACAAEAAGALDADENGCPDIVRVIDRDRDGFAANEDCDDTNADINPRATDRPGNRVDENCDGRAAPYPRVRAVVSTAAKAGRDRTAFTRLLVRGVPRGGKVELRCAAGRRARRACPFARRALTVEKGTADGLPRARKARRPRPLLIGVGAVLEVRITAPERIGKVVRYPIARRALPRSRTLCLPPGAAKARRCGG